MTGPSKSSESGKGSSKPIPLKTSSNKDSPQSSSGPSSVVNTASGMNENVAQKQGGGMDAGQRSASGSSSQTSMPSHDEISSSGLKDIAAKAQDNASRLYENATEWTRDSYENVRSQAQSRYGELSERSKEKMSQAKEGLGTFVNENPVMVGVLGLAAGLLIGALLPRTRQEDQVIGRFGDDLREEGLRQAREVARKGKELAEHTLGEGGVPDVSARAGTPNNGSQSRPMGH